MITARDVAKQLNEHEPLVDAFIQDKLVPVLMNNGSSTAYIPEGYMNKYFKDNNVSIAKDRLLSEFRKRGFAVLYERDDRSGGACWYIISVPPQED